MSKPAPMTADEVLDKLAKNTYKELRDIFPGQDTKWKKLDAEDRDYYRVAAAAVLHALVDQLRYINSDDLERRFTIREYADSLERIAAKV